MPLNTVKYRLTAVLALLSILLLFIAPLVSLSLYLSHPQPLSPPVNHASHLMSDEEMPGMVMPHAMPMQKSEKPTTTDTGMLCGYCELLVHFPFFLWIAAAILWLISALSRAAPCLPYQTILLVPCYQPQLSRGPPRVIG